MKKALLCLCLLLALLLCAAAACAETVTVTGSFGQSEARTMLQMINDFRTGSDAWYWESDNATKHWCSGLQTLTYDYDLEKVAMQRAIEVALYFDHTRPNGERCYTAYSLASGGYQAMGENIACGYGMMGDASQAFVGWQETDEPYAYQGHRRNMLSASFNRVGIGFVSFNGGCYWVQEFGYSSAAAPASTGALNGSAAMQVEISPDSVSSVALADGGDGLTVTYGQSADLPARFNVALTETWPGYAFPLELSPAWSVDDTSVASVSGAKLTGTRAGGTDARATVLGVAFDLPVTVKPADLSAASLKLSQSSYVYSGSAQRPGVTATLNGRALDAASDFTVGYSGNTDAGTARATITGQGNYTGSASASFTIKPASLADAAIDPIAAATYTGAAIQPAVKVSWLLAPLASGTDYTVSYANNTNAGTAKATATGKGNFTGTVSASFTINPANLSAAAIGNIPDAVYTGAALKPKLSVTYKGKTLASGTDFTASYANNVNAGAAGVTLTGKGNFTGTASAGFSVVPADISTATPATIPAEGYDGQAHTPAVSLSFGGKALAEGSDYAVAYADNVNAGQARAVVVGRGNFTGKTTLNFTINPIDLSGAEIAPIAAATYTGKAIQPAVTASLNGAALKLGADYTVSYENNVAAGTARAVVTGAGNYGGKAVAAFTINPASIENCAVEAIPTQAFTGREVVPTLSLSYNGAALKQGGDFTVTTRDGVGPGSATAVITGKGNFTGQIERPYEIKEQAVTGERKVGSARYDISKDGTAAYLKPTKSKSSVKVPDTISVNGKTIKVTSVDAKAFYKNTKLTSVTLGKNVKSIGKSAFSGCTKLKSVKGGALTSIGDSAFKGCKRLKSINLSKVKTVGANAFNGCAKLAKANLGSALTAVKDSAFKGCAALTSVTLGKNVKIIGKSAFSGCKKLKTVTIKSSKLKSGSIGSKAFKGIASKATFKCPKKKLKSYKKLLKKAGAPGKAKYKS